MGYRQDMRNPYNRMRNSDQKTDPHLAINAAVRKWQSGKKLTQEEKDLLIKSGQATKADLQ